jgi:CHAD domain-containing protein
MTREPDTPGAATGAAMLRGMPEDVLGEALKALDDASLSDAAAVHDFRKAMKRWRAMLRLLEPFLGDGGVALDAEARDLARALAGARDVRAALDALADLPDDQSLSARTRTSIRQRLEHLGASAEVDSISPATRDRLRNSLTYATQAARRWTLDEIDFDAIADELARSYRRARDAMPNDWAAADTERLHELRKRVIAHRHQMELVVPLWPRLGKLWLNEAQRLRDRLGHHQDLDVLMRMTALRQPLAHWRTRLVPLAAARQRAHVVAAARVAGRLFAEKPRAFRRRLLALWESREDTAQAATPDAATIKSEPLAS